MNFNFTSGVKGLKNGIEVLPGCSVNFIYQNLLVAAIARSFKGLEKFFAEMLF